MAQVLTLTCNALGDLGAMTVSDALSPVIPLIQLDLASNSIREAGADAIARALERGVLPKLKQLNLKNNDIGDKVKGTFLDHAPLQCSLLAKATGQPPPLVPARRLLSAGAWPSHAAYRFVIGFV